MTKAKAKPVTAVVVEDTHTINTVIDFKVTKADIIEMVLQEEEDRIDKSIADIQEQVIKLRIDKREQKIALEDKAIAKFDKHYAKIVSSFKNFIVGDASGGDNYYSIDNSRKGNPFNIDKCYQNLCGYYISRVVRNYHFANQSIDLKLTFKPNKKDLVAVFEIEKQIRDLESKTCDLRMERNSLHKKGKRARSKIVADLLGKSDAGSAILKQVKGMKNLLGA